MTTAQTNLDVNEALADQLRAWARGDVCLEAGTELLIRSGWAGAGRPWVKVDEVSGVVPAHHQAWIDFESMPRFTGAMSGGERAVLEVAASIAGTGTVALGDAIVRIDRRVVALVLAALAHASGLDAPGRMVRSHEGGASIVDVPKVFDWDDAELAVP